jgi:hypothetical protein
MFIFWSDRFRGTVQVLSFGWVVDRQASDRPKIRGIAVERNPVVARDSLGEAHRIYASCRTITP